MSVPDRGPQLIALMWAFTSISSITVAARIYLRAKKSLFGWNDVFMLLAALCFFGWSIVLTLLCASGGQQRFADVKLLGPEVISHIQLFNWTSQVFGIVGVAAGKVSIAALLLAILGNANRTWQHIHLWTVCIVLVCGVSISCSILTMTQCKPAAALWDPRVAGTCINPEIMANFGTFTGAYNTFVDASLSFIPATIFWNLQMNDHDKISLSIVFALNILTSICSGIKTSYLSELANRDDLTWATYDIFSWVTAELFLIIICGSIPTLKPILDFGRRRLNVRLQRTGSSYAQSRGESTTPSTSGLQMICLRRDAQGAKAVVMTSRTHDIKADSRLDSSRDIKITRSFKIKSESEENLYR